MPETRTRLVVDGTALSERDAARVRSVDVEESLGSPDKVSVTVTTVPDALSAWTSPLDALVRAAAPLLVRIERGDSIYEVDARSVAARWSIVPGGISTLTVEGLDRSVELDRRHERTPWRDVSDATIAEQIFARYTFFPLTGDTPQGTDPDIHSPAQDGTDWAFLTALADRNGFDVHVSTEEGRPVGVFDVIDPTAAPQARLALGHGDLGGPATATVALLTGQEVTVSRTIPGTSQVDSATDPGTGHAMGARSLGGARTVHSNESGGRSVVSAAATARARAERSAFGATLTTTLTAPSAPLVRARRTVDVAGLGEALDGRWLVRAVTHAITPGGHTQALTLIRNALGPTPAALRTGNGAVDALRSGGAGDVLGLAGLT